MSQTNEHAFKTYVEEISLLVQRKSGIIPFSALITAAVTGKFDVRNAVGLG